MPDSIPNGKAIPSVWGSWENGFAEGYDDGYADGLVDGATAAPGGYDAVDGAFTLDVVGVASYGAYNAVDGTFV